jgi:glutamate/tyrosine decarboxylase-like PLP-dependent enzyme
MTKQENLREQDSVRATSLDPADWDAFRRLAHAALDDAIDFVQSVRERPVWQHVPEAVKTELAEPVPVKPQELQAVYNDFVNRILPYSVGNIHPRFFGWVHGAGLPSGIVAEMMAAAMNANCGGRDHCGLYVERAVIDWCKSIFHFPATSSGILLTGTSMATLTGLAVARNSHHGADIRRSGLHRYPKTLVVYTSAEAHECIPKALEMLGLGRDSLHKIAVNDNFEIDVAALRKAILEDCASGLEPFCVVGTAGTVNTGAIDDLDSLAAICRENGLWFHVDGAFGALAVLSDEVRPRLRGMAMADSLAFDFHKWMHVQYDAGCLLVKDGEQHRRAFSMCPDYLHHASRGLAGGGEWPCDLGFELSRGFRALKVWFALKQHGVEAFGRAIATNCVQARYLAAMAQRSPNVQVMNVPSLSIVCFRFHPPGWEEAALDRLNEDVAADLQESGVAAPSTTRIRGALSIRVNITNHRTRLSDLDLLISAAVKAADQRIQQRSRVAPSTDSTDQETPVSKRPSKTATPP